MKPPIETDPAPDRIIAYKGFDKNLRCQGFQFEVGKTYTHDGPVVLCKSGFHACLNPLDVLDYKFIAGRFCRVELSGEIRSYDKELVAASITLCAELTLPEFINSCIDHLFTTTGCAAFDETSSGWGAPQANGADCAKQASSGRYARQMSSGDLARQAGGGLGTQQASSGYGACQASSGDLTEQASSGDRACQASSGNTTRQLSYGGRACQASSGSDTEQVSSGNGACQASSGPSTLHQAKGDNSVIAAAGATAMAKGVIGTWISLAEYSDGRCIGFATGCIGEDGLKPDVWYRAKDGKLVQTQLSPFER